MNRFKVHIDDVQYLSTKVLKHTNAVKRLSQGDICRLKKVSSMLASEKVPNSYLVIVQKIFDDKLLPDVRRKIIASNKKHRQYNNKDGRCHEDQVQISIDIKTRKKLSKLKKLKQYKVGDEEQSYDYVILQLMERSKELIKLKYKNAK